MVLENFSKMRLPEYGKVPQYSPVDDMFDLNPAEPSVTPQIYRSLQPHQMWLKDKVALSVQKSTQTQDYFAPQNAKLTVDEIAKMESEMNFADMQMEIDNALQGMDSSARKEILQQIANETMKTLKAPTKTRQAPSAAQAIVAALGALANPNYAFSIGATPYLAQEADAEERYSQDLQAYGAAVAERNAKIRALDSQLESQTQMDKYGAEQRIGAAKLGYQERNDLLGKMVDADKARMTQESLTERAVLNTQARLDVKQLDTLAKREFKLVDLLKTGGPDQRELAAKQLKDTYNLSDQDIADLSTYNPAQNPVDAKTGLSVAKTETENATREARVAKMNNEAKAVLGRIKLQDAQRKKIEQETALLLPKHQLEASKVQANLAKSMGDELTPQNIDKALGRYKKMRDMYTESLKQFQTYNRQTYKWEFKPGMEFHQDVLDLMIAIDDIDKKSLALSQQRPQDIAAQPKGAIGPMPIKGLTVTPAKPPAKKKPAGTLQNLGGGDYFYKP